MSEIIKENRYLVAVILLGIAIFMGQVADAGVFSLEDLPDVFRAVLDPIQFMTGMLIISFIFVITSIRKYELFPNPLLNTIKWYFAVMMVNDFVVLVFRVIQKSSILSLANSSAGPGKLYLFLASLRSITDSTISSAAVCLLVYGLSRYKPVSDNPSVTNNRMGIIVMVFVMIKWVFSIPVSMTGLLTNQTIYLVSLITYLFAGLVSLALIYMMVKNLKNRYNTIFFENLDRYFGIGLIASVLNFAYSIGSYGLIQRFPAGETELLGGFAKAVFVFTLITQAVQYYYMYRALDGYDEGEKFSLRDSSPVEIPQVTAAE